MKNTHEFEVTLRVGECAESSGTHREFGKEALETFAQVLSAYGMEVTTSYTASGKQAKLTVKHPEKQKADALRNRNPYGRPKKERDYNGVTLEWLESHSVAEGMEALGNVSRRTYYRRLEELRQK